MYIPPSAQGPRLDRAVCFSLRTGWPYDGLFNIDLSAAPNGRCRLVGGLPPSSGFDTMSEKITLHSGSTAVSTLAKLAALTRWTKPKPASYG